MSRLTIKCERMELDKFATSQSSNKDNESANLGDSPNASLSSKRIKAALIHELNKAKTIN